MIVGRVVSPDTSSVTDIKPTCGICGQLPVPHYNLCKECADAIMRAIEALHYLLEDKR